MKKMKEEERLTKSFVIRVSSEDYKRLETMAKKDERSVSNLVRKLIREAIARGDGAEKME